MRCAWMRAWPSVADGPTPPLHPAAPCDPARHGLRAETHLRAQCVDDLLLLLQLLLQMLLLLLVLLVLLLLPWLQHRRLRCQMGRRVFRPRAESRT